MISAPHLVGILNITTDSFSDGGLWLDPQQAFRHAQDMINDGATIIDIGAESTRPGAQRVTENIEQQRIQTIVCILTQWRQDTHQKFLISIDTTRSSVAQCALDQGADIINDVSGGTLDPQLPNLVADYNCQYIVQHWRQWLDLTKPQTQYTHGVLTDVYTELMHQVDNVLNKGVPPQNIIIDPGLGFSKPTPHHNYPLLTHLHQFTQSGYPVLIGASRKRFLQTTLTPQKPTQHDLDIATAIITAYCSLQPIWGVRVHNVHDSAIALAIAQQWKANQQND
ncbi:MAG: dihydropteroate synthase [Aeriscardovia sp.]|nr:dihydropteroate synthase [Aeriscardovia sp.]MBR3359565.1 dihydropteroate synthase [Aeriscardovia sp.]